MIDDKTWPRALIAFFVFFISTVVLFSIWSITRNPVDLVVKDYYAEELRHQEQIERSQRAATLPNPPRVAYVPAARHIAVTFPAPPESGHLHFYRPSDSALDQHHILTLDAEHRQIFEMLGFEPGLWRVRLTWIQDGEDFFIEQPLVLD
jgi:hypothetical protein